MESVYQPGEFANVAGAAGRWHCARETWRMGSGGLCCVTAAGAEARHLWMDGGWLAMSLGHVNETALAQAARSEHLG